MWNGTECGRGSDDLASCLVKHLKTHVKVVLCSNSSTGQNRSIKIVLSLMKLRHDPAMAVRTIDHKFMVSGHSLFANDIDFGLID